MNSHRKTLIIALVSVGLLGGAGAATVAKFSHAPAGIIRDGVRIAGIDCGKKAVETARAELLAWRDARLAEKVVIALPAGVQNGKRWTATRADLGVDVDIDATLEKAVSIGEQEDAAQRFAAWFTGHKAVDVAPKWRVDSAKLKKLLKRKVASAISREPKDARFIALEQGFKIEPERVGAALDLDAAASAVEARAASVSADPVELPVRLALPHVVAADLKGIQGEVASFRTHYTERGNRAKNIITACDHINGTVLKPGDKFSYNKVVGPREPEAGFKMAPVIIKGKLVPGMGGGVCQVSTTLYNAVLLSDLKIVRREHHAFPVHYVPAGRDATVAYGSIDFQFENTTNDVIAIAASGAKQQVLMRVFGKPAPNRQVNIERTNVSSWGHGEEISRDPNLPAGKKIVVDKGHAGHRVTVWRAVKVYGKLVKREQISHDFYKAFPAIITVGSGPAPTPRGAHRVHNVTSPPAAPGIGQAISTIPPPRP